MKNRILTLLVMLHLAILPKLFSQNVAINSTGNMPDTSAMLDVSSTSKGFLAPRMTTAEQSGIVLPATGLAVFNTTVNAFQVNTGTPLSPIWSSLITSTTANAWSIGGNGVASAQNIGTTTNFDFPFITNNTEKMRLSAGGNLGVGIAVPTALLHLKAGTAAANTAPLKFTSGALLTTAAAGAVEFLTDKFYGTITTSAARKEVTLNDIALTATYVPYVTTNGRLTNTAAFTYSGTRLSPKYITLAAGAAAAGSAPLIFTTGVNLTVPVTGAMEFNGTHFYGSVGATRYQLDQQAGTTYTGSNGITLSGTDFRNDLITGIAGGQTAVGGTASGNSLTLSSTSNATKGNIIFGTSAYDEPNNRLGLGNSTPTEALDITGNLKFSGALMPNNLAGTAGTFLTSNGTGSAPTWSAVTSSAWGLTGNSGTVSSNNFLGTTDGQDMVFKANNVERMRIVNGVSAQTGTTGDITIGDATSGTFRSAKEFVLREDGDLYGPSILRLRNRNGENGAIFETTGAGSGAYLVDFIFKTGTVASPVVTNLRFETRASQQKVTGNTTEWQIGQPDLVNGGPTMIVGAAGTGSNSAIRIGNFGIGTTNPSQKLDVAGNIRFSGALMPNNLAGTAGTFLTSNGAGTSPTWVTFDTANIAGFSQIVRSLFSASAPLTYSNGLIGITQANASTAGYISSADWNTFNGKADTANTWTRGGNGVASAQTIGTTTNFDFPFITNNTEKMRLSAGGNLGIGTTVVDGSNAEKLLVDAGTTSYNVISGKGNLNSYLQLNIKNNNSGTSASSDVVATNDAGTEANGLNFVDMGINSSGNTSTGVLGGANTGYLYSTGSDFSIGNAVAGKSLMLFTGGTASANERMRIDGNGNVGIGTVSPSTKLHIYGTNPLTLTGVQAGTTTSADSVLTITSGLVQKLPVSTFATSANTWSIGGNSVASAQNIGTTTNFDFPFITNNTEKMRLSAGGNLGIGTTVVDGSNAEKLLVDAGTTSYNVISGKGNLNSYLQLNIKNNNSGTSASSDVVATNDAGTEANGLNFVDMGVNSSGNTSTGVLGGANTGYLYSTGSDFSIGNAVASKSLMLFTGGTASANERMRIDGNGNVGIGTVSPSTKLHINGTNPLTLTGVQTGTATSADSILTITSGLVRKIPVSTFTSSANLWGTAGNSGTASGTNFIGTTDNKSFKIRTNNTQGILLDSLGYVAIGSAPVFDASNRDRLLVDADALTSNVITGKGDVNSYLQINVQNENNGNFASSDVVATANNGSSSTVYIDMGINSQGYISGNSSILNGSNSAYLYATGSDFYIGNGAQNKDLIFFTNTGGTGADGTERFRINSTALQPGSNNNYSLGTSSLKWTAVYATNGTIQTSDRRLKTNIEGLKYGLKEVLAMSPVRYNWKANPNAENKIGLIAQDVRKIIPEVVVGDEAKENIGMNYAELVPVLINAIKEQQQQIDALKKDIQVLKDKK
ncbi:MAG: tail fiber domain-containing protein [Ginsengibacter sp.]